jgi:hypothetical protein
LGILQIMGHEELAIDQIDVSLYRAKSLLQGVEQRPGVGVVVMGMGPRQRHRFRRRGGADKDKKEGAATDNHQDGWWK